MHLGSNAGSQLTDRNPQSISLSLLPSYLLCSDHKSIEARLTSCFVIAAD